MPFNRKNCLAFDVETGSKVNTEYALQPYRAMRNEADITSYATAMWTGAKLEAGAVNRPTREDLAKLVNYIIDNDLTVVGWNVAFDAAWLMGYGLVAEVHKIRWLDGMLLWQHLTREPEYDTTRQKKKSYSLKNAVREFLPKYAGYEEDIDFFDDSPAMVAKRLKYNKLDAAFTLRLTEQFYNTLEKTNPKGLRNALIEASAISSMAESIVNGLVVDVPQAQAMQGRLDQTAAAVGARLAEYGLTPEIIASPKQLTHKLYEEWKLPVYSTTPKGAPSADKVALYLLSAEDERVREITKLREATGNRTKFVDKILASVEYNEDGCTRPWPRIYGTYTGRVTFSSTQGRNKEERQTGFALHQMKRDKEFRKIITVPQGFVLCEWDAAGQEYRWMAIESGDTKMLELCEPGHDPHAYMGAEITHVGYEGLVIAAHAGDPVAKNTRQMGKVGNLSCQYRISDKKLWQTANVNFGLPITKPEATKILLTYHRTYPGVEQYWRRKIMEARRRGYAETLAGRRVQLTGSWTNRQTSWQLESTAVNFPIQGVGADQKYLAIKVLRHYLNQYGGRFYFELHDGLYAILPVATAPSAARVIQRALNRLPYEKAWGFAPPIPLPWDLKMGANWGEMTEVTDD
jgi:DNA polymerase I-like protein with 3'-5' exonuclease and polymerase domains